jgi:hypothetical protein
MILSQHGIIQSINRGGGIVTDGLVMHLDAGNAASYPGSGTTWTDLSGNGKNATLVNGVSYSSDNGGVLSLDGVDDYMTLHSSLSVATDAAFSVEICFNITSFANTYPNIFQIKTNTQCAWQISVTNFAAGGGLGYAGILFGSATFVNPTWANFSTGRDNASEVMVANTWNHIVVTYNGSGQMSAGNYTYYRNAVSKNFTGADPFGNTNQQNYIGCIDADRFFFNSKIPIARIYNRVLSAAEVEQNFNVTKDRYGL